MEVRGKNRTGPKRRIDVEVYFRAGKVMIPISYEAWSKKLYEFEEHSGMRISKVVAQIILQAPADLSRKIAMVFALPGCRIGYTAGAGIA